MRIILLADDPDHRTLLGERLRSEGFTIDLVGSIFEFYRQMATESYDIAVIDTDVPGDGGLDVVSWLRRKDGMRVVLLTAHGEVGDRIEGYRRGGDLCLMKPVDDDELAAAMYSIARRLGHVSMPKSEAAEPRGHWLFDPNHWILQAPNGRSLKLSAAEMKITERLIERPGTAISREELLAALGYGLDKGGNQKLDALISRFRHKIQNQTGCAAPVQTPRGRGHLFSAPVRTDGSLRSDARVS